MQRRRGGTDEPQGFLVVRQIDLRADRSADQRHPDRPGHGLCVCLLRRQAVDEGSHGGNGGGNPVDQRCPAVGGCFTSAQHNRPGVGGQWARKYPSGRLDGNASRQPADRLAHGDRLEQRLVESVAQRFRERFPVRYDNAVSVADG